MSRAFILAFLCLCVFSRIDFSRSAWAAETTRSDSSVVKVQIELLLACRIYFRLSKVESVAIDALNCRTGPSEEAISVLKGTQKNLSLSQSYSPEQLSLIAVLEQLSYDVGKCVSKDCSAIAENLGRHFALSNTSELLGLDFQQNVWGQLADRVAVMHFDQLSGVLMLDRNALFRAQLDRNYSELIIFSAKQDGYKPGPLGGTDG